MLEGTIEDANRLAVAKIQQGDPVLVDIARAGDVIPELQQGVLLHAGPPIEWQNMCGPMRGAAIGAMRYEGWSKSEEEAETMASGGSITFHPAHDFRAVGPMTGIFSPSMPVFVIENRSFGNRAFCTINEGLGRVLRFGANDDMVIDRLRWIQNTLAPVLREAVQGAGSIELRPLMSQALAMSDEMHQRNAAATSLFIRGLVPHLVRTTSGRAKLEEVTDFLVGNDQFFLNLAMAAAKATLDAAKAIESSTVVYAMTRNGTDFGIRVSGLGEQWFTAPVQMPRGLYFPGFSEVDANPDLGDSAILETMGLGAFAMAGSPAVAGFLGAGTFRDALNYTSEMREITVSQNPNLPIPNLDFLGVPCGIDVRKVVETGIAPVINTGIAHKDAGVGQVGAGIVRAPLECFYLALEALVSGIQ